MICSQSKWQVALDWDFNAAFYIFLRRVWLYWYKILHWTDWKAEKSARDASQRERDAQKRLKEQQSLYEERISSLRIDLGKLKEAYLKLEKHNSKDKYKRMLIEKKSKLELTERLVILPLNSKPSRNPLGYRRWNWKFREKHGKIRIPNFCYIQVIVFDLSYLPVAAVGT